MVVSFCLDAENVDILLCDENVKHMLFPDLLFDHSLPIEVIGCLYILDLRRVNVLEPLIFVLKVYVFE